MVTKIVVVGGGGHAKVLLHVLSQLAAFEVMGYVDPRSNGPILGFPRLGGDEILAEIVRTPGVAAAVGVGKVKAGRDRGKIFGKLRSLGFALPAILSPRATVARDAVIGEGSVVMDGAVVQPGCVVGAECIVNTGAVLDHDCVLGDDVHVGPRAALSGNVSVGAGSMVGVGASVIQGVRITEDCTIGAGAAVTRDCVEAGTYVGVPARKEGA